MNIVRNLPTLLALSASVILCIIGVKYNSDFKEISVKLLLGITVFYMFGMFIRKIAYRFLVGVYIEKTIKIKELKAETEKNKAENARY